MREGLTELEIFHRARLLAHEREHVLSARLDGQDRGSLNARRQRRPHPAPATATTATAAMILSFGRVRVNPSGTFPAC
jgi:hypothetical protein